MWTWNPVQHFFFYFFHWHSVYSIVWHHTVGDIMPYHLFFIIKIHYLSHGWLSPSNLPKWQPQREKGEAPTMCSSGFYKSLEFQTNYNLFYHQLSQKLLSFLCIVYFPLDWIAEFKYLELFYLLLFSYKISQNALIIWLVLLFIKESQAPTLGIWSTITQKGVVSPLLNHLRKLSVNYTSF